MGKKEDTMRHRYVAERQQSLLMVIDIQQAMLKVITQWEAVTRRVNQLSAAAGMMDIPILITEHYKKGLGPTIPDVSKGMGDAAVFQKEFFSACLEDRFLETVRLFDRPQIVLTGMETHVCVLQTGLDLIRAGYQVQLVRNAVASRYKEDWQTAVEIFRDAGAVITTAETVIFQWAHRSNTELFRQLLPVVK